jgi:hypothetical protein
MVSSNETWILGLSVLNQNEYHCLRMENIIDPSSWVAVDNTGVRFKMSDKNQASLFFGEIFSNMGSQEIWASV